MDRLKGKVALISGGARGQGAAEARLFVAEGAKVVIGDVLDKEARALAEEINRSKPKSVLPIHLDVTRASDWRAAVDACEREFGALDILVNNAGILNLEGIVETSEEEWDAVVTVNQKGRMARDESCGGRDAQSRRRLDHQHLLDIRNDRIGRFRPPITAPRAHATPD